MWWATGWLRVVTMIGLIDCFYSCRTPAPRGTAHPHPTNSKLYLTNRVGLILLHLDGVAAELFYIVQSRSCNASTPSPHCAPVFVAIGESRTKGRLQENEWHYDDVYKPIVRTGTNTCVPTRIEQGIDFFAD